jgi:hypothetical protein
VAPIAYGFAETMKRLGKYLVAGVVVQILIVLIVVLAGQLLTAPPQGPTNPLWEYIYIAALLSSPGLMMLGPHSTATNPHPAFSTIGLLLGIILDILFYSLIAYIAVSFWRDLQARFTKST